MTHVEFVFSDDQKELGTILSYIRIIGIRVNICIFKKIPFWFRVIKAVLAGYL